jgi:hypothetical protein
MNKYHQSLVTNQSTLLKHGIVSKMLKDCGLSNAYHNTVKNVIIATQDAELNGIPYDGTRQFRRRPNQEKIKQDSIEMHLIACTKQQGASFRLCTMMLNTMHLKKDNLPEVGYTAVYNAVNRSNHKKASVVKRHQASNRNVFWRQARFQFCAQMLVRFGKPLPVDTSGVRFNDDTALDRQKIVDNKLTLDICGIAWWDEKHIQQCVGSIKDQVYQFGYDDNGLYCNTEEVDDKQVVSTLIACIYRMHLSLHPYLH